MHKILVIRLYFPLDPLNVSHYVSPSSGLIFISRTSHIPVYAGICDVRLIKVAPVDGLTQCETCRASNGT